MLKLLLKIFWLMAMLTRVNHPWEHCAHQDSLSADGIWQIAMQVHGTFLWIDTGKGLICWAGVDWQKLWWSSVDLYWSKACSSLKEALSLNQILYCTIFIQGISFMACVFLWGCICKLGKRQGAVNLTLLPVSRFWLQVSLLSFSKAGWNKLGWWCPPGWRAAVRAAQHWLHPSMQLHWHQRQGGTASAG